MIVKELLYSTFDESEFPIVKVTFNIKDPTLSQFMQFIEGQKKLLEGKLKFVLFMDARKVGFLSSEIRIAQGNFFKEYKMQLGEYCLGAVLLVSSPLVKMMIKGMMLIEPPPNKTLVSNNESEARRIVENILSGNELQVAKEHYI